MAAHLVALTQLPESGDARVMPTRRRGHWPSLGGRIWGSAPCGPASQEDSGSEPTSQDVAEFLNGVAPAEKRRDSFTLLEMMQKVTGEKAVMWGPSIVGFGTYHYKSERSRQEGDWPLVGFSPRKQNLSLYVLAGSPDQQELLAKLGKHKASVGCLYVKRLSDVDQTVLATLVESSFRHMKKIHGQEAQRWPASV